MYQGALDLIQRRSVSIALYAAGAVQVYLMFLAIDSMFLYTTGIDRVSPLIRGVALIALLLVLIRNIATRRLRYDALLLAFIAYMFVGAIVGFAYHGPSYIFGRHLFASLMMVTSYWVGLYLTDRMRSQSRALEHIAWATAVACVIFVAVALYFGYLGRPYTSLNVSVPLLFALDVALIQQSWWLVALCLVVIFATNLRSGMMGACLMGATYLVFRFLRNRTLIIFSPVLAVLFFAGCAALIIAVSTFLPQIGISERLQTTFNVFSAFTNGSHDGFGILLERLTTHRFSQTVAVWDAIKSDRYTMLFGGFGGEYRWRYFSEPWNGWGDYTLHQTDLMTAYFLLTGGVVFAVLMTLLICWKIVQVYLNLFSGFRLGALFVIGFGFAAFFGFQPNVPLFWLLLAGLSQPASRASMLKTGTRPSHGQVVSVG